MSMGVKVVALAGGVGGAKFADGLARILDPRIDANEREYGTGVEPSGGFPAKASTPDRAFREESRGRGAAPHVLADSSLTVIVNVGDDFEHLGLRICPDLDTVTYTLAGLAHPDTGWGLAGETWNAMETLGRYGGETWFRLGDRDLGMHLFRTSELKRGRRLTKVTAQASAALGVKVNVLPATDSLVPTIVETDQGTLAFQEYFVHRRCEPVVKRIRFEGIESARPTDEVIAAIDAADLIVVCPSNPFVSIDPILALGDIRERVKRKPVIGVSPIIGGQAVKGPAAKMLRELGYEASALSVARRYADVLDMFVIDAVDKEQVAGIEGLGMRVRVTDTLMKSIEDRGRLARDVLDFAGKEERQWQRL